MNTNTGFLTGNLTQDPESRELASGTTLTEFRVAVNEVDGQGEQVVSYFNIACFGKLAENVASYCHKGRSVAVTYRLKQDRWEDPSSGQKRQAIKLIARQVEFLGSGRRSEAVPAGAGADSDIPF